MDVKAAVLGTDDYHGVMREAATNALQRTAGYLPDSIGEASATNYSTPRGYAYPIECCDEVKQVWQWCNGRGWICGSSALWEYSRSRDAGGTHWTYGDIDVFAHSDNAYYSLLEEAKETFLDVETDYSFKGSNVQIPVPNSKIIGTLNIVRPPQDVSWENPMSVWESFDLNVAQCVIVSPAWVSVCGSLSLINWQFDTEDFRPFLEARSGIKSAARFGERVQKYLARGFRLGSRFWWHVLDIAEQKGPARLAEYCSLIRLLGGLLDEESRLKMQANVDNVMDYLNGDTPDTYESDEYEDYYDDDYDWFS